MDSQAGEVASRGVFTQRPRTTSRPESSSSSWAVGSLPARSPSSSLSIAMICETLATESWGRPVAPCGQQRVPRRLRPPQVARKRHANRGGEATSIQGITLHDHDRPSKPGARSAGGWEDRPTRSRPARSPLDALQHPARGDGQEFISRDADLVAGAIHGFGDLVRRVARHVLPERSAVERASRLPLALRQSFHLVEDLVRDRNRCFHTKSMTEFGAVRPQLAVPLILLVRHVGVPPVPVVCDMFARQIRLARHVGRPAGPASATCKSGGTG